MELKDAQWAVIELLMSAGKSSKGRVGRPRRNNREVIEGILSILHSGGC